MPRKLRQVVDFEDLPEATKKAVMKIRKHRDRFFFFYMPYELLLDWLEGRFYKDNPDPHFDDPKFFEDWSRKELIYRVKMQQIIARAEFIELEFLQKRLGPVLLFLCVLVGMLIGRGIR